MGQGGYFCVLLLSWTSVQQGLPDPEMPLLPDPDRAYALPGIGSLGEGMGKGRPEQGAATPEGIGIL